MYLHTANSIARNPINQCTELHPFIIHDIRKVIEENIKITH